MQKVQTFQSKISEAFKLLDQQMNLSHSDDPDGSAQEGYLPHLNQLCELYEQCHVASDDAAPTTTQSQRNIVVQHELIGVHAPAGGPDNAAHRHSSRAANSSAGYTVLPTTNNVHNANTGADQGTKRTAPRETDALSRRKGPRSGGQVVESVNSAAAMRADLTKATTDIISRMSATGNPQATEDASFQKQRFQKICQLKEVQMEREGVARKNEADRMEVENEERKAESQRNIVRFGHEETKLQFQAKKLQQDSDNLRKNQKIETLRTAINDAVANYSKIAAAPDDFLKKTLSNSIIDMQGRLEKAINDDGV